MTAESRYYSVGRIPSTTRIFTALNATMGAWFSDWKIPRGTKLAKGWPMRELLGALVWLAICALSILFWWPLLVVVVQYWIGPGAG